MVLYGFKFFDLLNRCPEAQWTSDLLYLIKLTPMMAINWDQVNQVLCPHLTLPVLRVLF